MAYQETELRQRLSNLCDELKIKGHLFLYVEGDKVKIVGSLSFAALAPLILEFFARKI